MMLALSLYSLFWDIHDYQASEFHSLRGSFYIISLINLRYTEKWKSTWLLMIPITSHEKATPQAARQSIKIEKLGLGLGFKPRIASAFGQIPPWPHPRPEDKTGAESPNRWIVKVSPWNARLIRENSSYLNRGLNRNEKIAQTGLDWLKRISKWTWTWLSRTHWLASLSPPCWMCLSVVPWVCFLSWELAWGIAVPMGREKEKRGRGEWEKEKMGRGEWEKGEGGAER